MYERPCVVDGCSDAEAQTLQLSMMANHQNCW